MATTGWQAGRNTITQGDLAVQFALSQVGKPYVYGAAGPYGYDCSGLALASWRAAGVELPRTAAAQYYAGSHVPLGQLQPGDLIFWASDV
jgi:peptidoglycan DL-endopeptidase CwlO